MRFPSVELRAARSTFTASVPVGARNSLMRPVSCSTSYYRKRLKVRWLSDMAVTSVWGSSWQPMATCRRGPRTECRSLQHEALNLIQAGPHNRC